MAMSSTLTTPSIVLIDGSVCLSNDEVYEKVECYPMLKNGNLANMFQTNINSKYFSFREVKRLTFYLLSFTERFPHKVIEHVDTSSWTYEMQESEFV